MIALTNYQVWLAAKEREERNRLKCITREAVNNCAAIKLDAECLASRQTLVQLKTISETFQDETPSA